MHLKAATAAMELQALYPAAHLRFLFKNLLDYVLLQSLRLLDMSFGAIYFVLDAIFEGLEASKAKDVILPHNLSSSFSSSSLSSCSSSVCSSTRSSQEFGEEEIIPFYDCNSTSIDFDGLQMLSTFTSAIPSGGSPEINFSKPRRAGIIAERRQKNTKNNFSSSDGAPSCTCWGWQVEEENLVTVRGVQKMLTQQELFIDNDNNVSDSRSSNFQEHEDITVRWSECQCPDCRRLWMPMSRARSRLHVQTWNPDNNYNNNSNPERNRNTRKSRSFFNGSLESFDALRRQSLPRSSSSTAAGDAGSRNGNRNRNSNSNLTSGAKSGPQCAVDCSGRSVVEEGKINSTGIIFLHGIFSSSDFWFDSNIVPILDGELKSRHLILAPDLLGCGRSPRPYDSVYTLSDQIDALENSLLKKHGLESFHIVAHSMGTIPALAFAARFSQRVRSITLIAPVYAGYSGPSQGCDEILTDCNSILSFQDPWSVGALRSLTAAHLYNINRFVGHLLFSRHQLLVPIFQRLLQNSFPRSFVRDYLAVTHDAAWHIVHNTMIGGSHAVVPALRKLRDRGLRVFVIHGTEDSSCPFKQSVLMAEHFDNVVLAAAPGKGHVDVVLGRDDEVIPILEQAIRLGDRSFPNT